MRLLHTTNLTMKEFFDTQIPEYAILSHTWGHDEVSYQDFQHEYLRREKEGYAKIKGVCSEASKRGYTWVWIDTCCIDKTSSAELSEAINSMYRWYAGANECIVYLSDVDDDKPPTAYDSAFRKSRWYTRGWTLQELLAPDKVIFYDKTWGLIGEKTTLSYVISEVTNIQGEYLHSGYLIRHASMALRISWASSRTTSRQEDMAYCLLGLLGVTMPLLYGEGERAFIRLQEEIIRSTYDHTILAWGLGLPYDNIKTSQPASLASSPAAFKAWDNRIKHYRRGDHYLPTNLGIRIELPVFYLPRGDQNDSLGLALLDCGVKDQTVALPLEVEDFDPGDNTTLKAIRARGVTPFLIPAVYEDLRKRRISLYLLNTISLPKTLNYHTNIKANPLFKIGYTVNDVFPPCAFYEKTHTFSFWDYNCYQRLFRLCNPHYPTILIMVIPEMPLGKGTAEIKTAFTDDSATSWQLVLQADYGQIDFEHLKNSLLWTTRGYTANLPDHNHSLLLASGEIRFEVSEIEDARNALVEQSLLRLASSKPRAASEEEDDDDDDEEEA